MAEKQIKKLMSKSKKRQLRENSASEAKRLADFGMPEVTHTAEGLEAARDLRRLIRDWCATEFPATCEWACCKSCIISNAFERHPMSLYLKEIVPLVEHGTLEELYAQLGFEEGNAACKRCDDAAALLGVWFPVVKAARMDIVAVFVVLEECVEALWFRGEGVVTLEADIATLATISMLQKLVCLDMVRNQECFGGDIVLTLHV